MEYRHGDANSLGLRTVSALEGRLDDTLYCVYSALRRVRVNGSDVWYVTPDLGAVRGHEKLFQRDNLLSADGGILHDNKRSIDGKEIRKGCCRCWILSLGIESDIDSQSLTHWDFVFLLLLPPSSSFS